MSTSSSQKFDLNSLAGCRFGNWELLEKRSVNRGQSIWILPSNKQDMAMYACTNVSATEVTQSNYLCKIEKITGALVDAEKRLDFLRKQSSETCIFTPKECGTFEQEGFHFTWEIYPILEYGSLKDFLLNKDNGEIQPSSETILIELVKQTAKALEAAKQNHVVHRDIKASNVFVLSIAPDFQVALGDFGIAKRRTSGANNSRYGRKGTKWNFAPDQLLEFEGDCYSLGLMLLEVAALIGINLESDLLKVALEDKEWAEAEERINQCKKMRLWPASEIDRLPGELPILVRRLLVLNPKKRLSSGDIIQFFDSGKLPPLRSHEKYEPIDPSSRSHPVDRIQASYPQDLVQHALTLPKNQRDGFYEWFIGGPSQQWILAWAFDRETKSFESFERRYDTLKNQYHSAKTAIEKEFYFFLTCFHLDPTCRLPWNGSGEVYTLDDLWHAFAKANVSELMALAHLLEPFDTPTCSSVSLLEIWIQETHITPSYWQDELSQAIRKQAAFVLSRIQALRPLAQKRLATPNPDFAVMLRYCMLFMALDGCCPLRGSADKLSAEYFQEVPPLVIRNIPGVFIWDSFEEQTPITIRDCVSAAKLLIAWGELGDHLRRSGLLSFWLDACSTCHPGLKSLGNSTQFATSNKDAILTVLLAWELLGRLGRLESLGETMLHNTMLNAIQAINKDALSRWINDNEWVVQITAGCAQAGKPCLFLERLTLCKKYVLEKLGEQIWLQILGDDSAQEVPVGIMIVALSFSPHFRFDEMLAHFSRRKTTIWWNGLIGLKEIGRWMLNPGNHAKADAVRRSGMVQVWLICEEKRRAEADAVGLLAPTWIEDLGAGNAELTTRFAVMLAGKGGPEVEISYMGPSKDGSMLLNAGEALTLAPMKSRQGTRKVRFKLQNVEKELPGTLCCTVSIDNKKSIFGDPVLVNSKSRFVRMGEKLSMIGNELTFEVQINTTQGRVSGAPQEEAILTIRYNHQGSAKWKTLFIPLRCPVEVNHRKIMVIGLLGAVFGAVVFGCMGWWLMNVSDISRVEEKGADGELLAGHEESGAEHWWRRRLERPEENLHAGGGAMEPNSNHVPGYFEQSSWGLVFPTLLILALTLAFQPKKLEITTASEEVDTITQTEEGSPPAPSPEADRT